MSLDEKNTESGEELAELPVATSKVQAAKVHHTKYPAIGVVGKDDVRDTDPPGFDKPFKPQQSISEEGNISNLSCDWSAARYIVQIDGTIHKVSSVTDVAILFDKRATNSTPAAKSAQTVIDRNDEDEKYL